jgi:16S rRNA (guanine527-N7)-methyltransferase
VEPLRRHCATASSKRVLDVGSGGGLPGIVIAALNPGLQVTCVDTVGKKAAFIRQAAGELGLKNLVAQHARVEQLRAAPFDVIVSRAFSSLADFTRLTRQHLAPRGVWMAMKGKTPDEEMAQLPADIAVFHVEQLSVPGLQAERCLVWIRP